MVIYILIIELMIEKAKESNSAAKVLLQEINDLKTRFEAFIAERDFERRVTVTPYEMIPNAPNCVVRISSQPDALLVEYADWSRTFIPLYISRWWMM